MRSKAVRAAPETYSLLSAAHPDAHCELNHDSPFQLIVATVLSAQATDASINRVTPELFRRWPTPRALAAADVGDVERALSSIGMFRQKAKNVTALAKRLVQQHDGEVPRDLAALVALPGVGRKTANVVLGVAFGIAEGVVVDTHVQRISQRLGWTRQTTPERIERDLVRLFPQKEWPQLSHVLIFHGRRICTARSPQCAGCPVSDRCPSAFAAERVGRKPPKARAAATPGAKRSVKKARGTKKTRKAAAKTTARTTPAKKATAKTTTARTRTTLHAR